LVVFFLNDTATTEIEDALDFSGERGEEEKNGIIAFAHCAGNGGVIGDFVGMVVTRGNKF
jgi:hypothetical protein